MKAHLQGQSTIVYRTRHCDQVTPCKTSLPEVTWSSNASIRYGSLSLVTLAFVMVVLLLSKDGLLKDDHIQHRSGTFCSQPFDLSSQQLLFATSEGC
jgi:hypothetical protein